MAIKEKKWKPLGKKHNWTEKRVGDFFFELKIKDATGRKIDRFVWNSEKRFKEILEILRLSYGLDYKS